MKFRKLNENSVECTLTEEELDEYEISLEELCTQSEESREFIKKMVRLAMEEVDYKPSKNGNYMVQIYPNNNNEVKLIIADVTNSPLKGLLDSILGGLISKAKEEIDSRIGSKASIEKGEGSLDEAHMTDNYDDFVEKFQEIYDETSDLKTLDDKKSDEGGEKASFKIDDSSLELDKTKERAGYMEVPKFEKLVYVVDQQVDYPMESYLFYNEDNGHYFLAFKLDPKNAKVNLHIIRRAKEHGLSVKTNSLFIDLASERYKTIFYKDAFEQLKELL